MNVWKRSYTHLKHTSSSPMSLMSWLLVSGKNCCWVLVQLSGTALTNLICRGMAELSRGSLLPTVFSKNLWIYVLLWAPRPSSGIPLQQTSQLIWALGFSPSFLLDLEQRVEENIVISDVCDIVYQHTVNHFSVYITYVSNQTYQERAYKQLLWVPVLDAILLCKIAWDFAVILIYMGKN